MNRRHHRVFPALLLAAGLGGCTGDQASIEIFAICSPPADATACGTSGTCDKLLAAPRPFVYLRDSLGNPNGLFLFVQVNNQLPKNGDLTAGRVNTNDFLVERYKYRFPGTGLADIEVPANGTVPAASSSTPVVPLLPVEVSPDLRTLMNAAGATTAVVSVELRIAGRLTDGSSHETGVFKVAVDVVNAQFPGFGCPKAGDVVTAVCPNDGQTASITCEAP
jgi:hypothetical protein